MEEDKIYHILQQRQQQRKHFPYPRKLYLFLNKYKTYVSPFVDTYAYCLMPNHFHFLIKVKHEEEVTKNKNLGSIKRDKTTKVFLPLSSEEESTVANNIMQTTKINKTFVVSTLTDIEKAFRDFFISYAKAFNKQNNRTGSLFQYKFKRKLINEDSYLSSITAYIHLNPVKANLCNNLEEWEFSSYKAYLTDKVTAITRDPILEWFGGIEYFKKFHLEYLEDKKIKELLVD
jgi:REP element-mobilizing transposase RayT